MSDEYMDDKIDLKISDNSLYEWYKEMKEIYEGSAD